MPKRRGKSSGGASLRSGTPTSGKIEALFRRFQGTMMTSELQLETPRGNRTEVSHRSLETTLSPDVRPPPLHPCATSSPGVESSPEVGMSSPLEAARSCVEEADSGSQVLQESLNMVGSAVTTETGPTQAEGSGGERSNVEYMRNLLARTLGLGSEKPEKVLEELTLEGVAKFVQSDKCKNVVCMVGAGISTSAGIPDFRSPGTGLYANLQKYDLPYPEAIFEINYFKSNPEPFFTLARELYPGQFKPTVCHYFLRLLKEKGLLQRCYTQNIDTLERVAGLQQDDLVEAHGTFFTSHCVSTFCRKEYTLSWMKEKIFSDLIPKCEKCSSVVKPDIVLFGESLPARFFSCIKSDFQKIDLLIIMGTSLQVQPFASLVGKVPANVPRLLINKEKTGESGSFMALLGFGCGMDFDSEKAYRDVAWLGNCDDGCMALAEHLGWKKELEDLVNKEHAAIDAKSSTEAARGVSGAQSTAEVKEKASLAGEKKQD
uniref:NAD-dependent protein deacetylase sirtuin-2 n=1 Tax=Geotrypetes seraphini TaxID=260995 RepID=A0A6P8S0Z4_GEOSA|nr:NAD-dependent protein deacetylase sirtuin-2 isoform X2 [Geotrypetes seraphini]XP_033811474.1 NAD-dependent protein deacetylase sirtuin-2 isoform X2 [Geotrypetes seraphini]